MRRNIGFSGMVNVIDRGSMKRKRGGNMNLKLLAISGALLAVFVTETGKAQAPKPDYKALAATGILERLAEPSGAYGVPATAIMSGVIADASWTPKPPNNSHLRPVRGPYV